MTTFWETIVRYLSRWALPTLLSVSGFALIGHIFTIPSTIGLINSILVLAGTALVFTAMLLSPSDIKESESVSGQIFSFERRYSDSSRDTSEDTERHAA